MKFRIVLYALTLLSAAPAWSHAQGHPVATSGRGNVGFWLSVPDGQNTLFDDQTIRMLASRARFIILNAPMEGPAPQYKYEAIVRRFRETRPDLPVLIYTWATFGREGPRIGEATMKGFAELGSLLLRDTEGDALKRKGGGQLLGDPRKKGFRDWHVDRVSAMLAQTAANGVHLDGAQRTNPVVKRTRQKGAEDEYGRGMDALFQALKARIGPTKLLTFNGLWTHNYGGLADQERLLTFADGTAVEFFGAPAKEGVRPFGESVLPYITAIPKHPSKVILVIGRGSFDYVKYEDDYLWQRYLYAAYLMSQGRNTVFKFQSDFPTIPRIGVGRSGSLDIYADWELDLGEAQGPYQERAGVYSRRFAKGLVLMAPHGGRPGSYALPRPMFTPEGEQIQGSVIVRPGQGHLLFDAAPPLPPLRVENFRDERPAVASWRWAQLGEAEGKRVLRLERTPDMEDAEHDLMLDWVRSLKPPTKVRMRVRTRDAAAELRFVAEVDDRENKDTHVVVTAVADGKPKGARAEATPFRANAKGFWPSVPGSRSAWHDGAWHDITIEGAEVLGGNSRFSFRRWSHVRVVGAVEVEQVEVTGRAAR